MNLKKIILSILVMITFTTIALSQNYVSYFNKGNNYYAEYQKITQDSNLNSDDFLQMNKLLDEAEYNYKKALSMMGYGDTNIRGVNNNLEIVKNARTYIAALISIKKGAREMSEEERSAMKGLNDALTPKERVSKSYYNNGQLKSIGKYRRTIFDSTELKAGEWKSFHENGQLSLIGKYENGDKTGEWKLYNDNGQLSLIAIYENGNATGEWKFYHENGQLSSVGKIENGNKTGEWKTYHENGQLSLIGKYENGKYTDEWKIYHENGNISSVLLWHDDKLMDIITCKDDQGNLLDKGTLIKGNGTVNDYDKNGELLETITYKEGVRQ